MKKSAIQFHGIDIGLVAIGLLFTLLGCVKGDPSDSQNIPVDPGEKPLSDAAKEAFQHLEQVQDKYHTTFDVYTNQDEAGNHFAPSGWMGDTAAVTIDNDWNMDCYLTSPSCIRFTFNAAGNNWAGLYWQQPSGNWGTVSAAGFDLRGATKLTFWAKGESGGETIEFFVGGIEGDNGDSISKITLGYVTLTNQWTQYAIDLQGKDLSYIIGGFGWVTTSSRNSNGATFYLDNIQYDLVRLNQPRFLVSFETLNQIEPDRYMRNVSFIYDNALALIAFLKKGDQDALFRAKLIADAFIIAQQNDVFYTDGRLRNAYMAGDLLDHVSGKARLPGWWDPIQGQWIEDELNVSTHTGNLAWVVIALVNYFQSQGGEMYLEAAISIAEWIVSHTYDERGNGGFSGGYQGWPPTPQKILWKSTEQNIDCYVAFSLLHGITLQSRWEANANHARQFVESMWNDANHHFWTGTDIDGITPVEYTIPIDVQAWAVLAFKDYTASLNWAEQNGKTTHGGFTGFDFNNDLDGVWFEGTAQMAVAYQASNLPDAATALLEELRLAQETAPNGNGKGLVASTRDPLTTGFDWVYYQRLHIGATAWFLFAESEANPWDVPDP
ncbi:hypothetical protein [Kaarinaea lacus]